MGSDLLPQDTAGFSGSGYHRIFFLPAIFHVLKKIIHSVFESFYQKAYSLDRFGDHELVSRTLKIITFPSPRNPRERCIHVWHGYPL